MRPPILIALLLLCPPAFAGPLDLDIYQRYVPTLQEPPRRPELPRELWQPGTSLALRGEGPVAQSISHVGYTTLGAWGLAQSAGSFNRSRNDKAATVGFGVITAVQLFSDYFFFRDLSRSGQKPDVDFFFSQNR